MTTDSPFQWVRPAQQARSQETFERLLDSAESLLENKGFEEVTVAEIASGAGFSVGAVYSRFCDKDGVLQCLQDRFVTEACATADESLAPARWQGASIEAVLRDLISFLVQIHRERIGILRELVGRLHSDAGATERKKDLIEHVSQLLAALLLERRHEIAHPDPAASAAFGLRLVLGTLEQAILFEGRSSSGFPTSDDQLASELTRALLGYLGVELRH